MSGPLVRSAVAAFSLLLAALPTVGCGGTDAGSSAVAEDDVTSSATIRFVSGFTTNQTGTARAGTNVRVEYALDRLPDCRGDLPGGAPGWNVTGYVSENGGPARTFEVSAVSPDGRSRVAKAAIVPITQGGRAAFWFQIHNRWGCSAFDSAHGQNYGIPVSGPTPDVKGTITFTKDGKVEQTGDLLAGAKVKVRYEQERLPQCRRYERGHAAWTITGFASHAGEAAQTFQTGREGERDRVTEDAILDLPRAGELSLWFQVTSLGGCSAYDSKDGANYRFTVR
jgi:hypothetical protein